MRAAVAALAVVVLVGGCAADDEAKAEAVQLALAKPVAGGSLGDCLNIAGYDVRPDYLQEFTIKAPGDAWWRVAFQNEKDTGADFVHVGVNTNADIVVPYKEEDTGTLAGLNCAVSGRTVL